MSLPPSDFLEKMSALLGAEFAAFAASYDSAPASGLRVNTLRRPAADYAAQSPFDLTPVGEAVPEGFVIGAGATPGKHPQHAAGLYYLQEPSAMGVGALVDAQPGEWVLDVAAAPGGKSTHLAARMHNRGLLVANDVNSGRARILVENLERCGVTNAVVTSSPIEKLAEALGPVFDRVLVDAPCSGEGMFRKNPAVEWSESIVAACARRQTELLPQAARLVKPGGVLVYSTCTFSPEENEGVIAAFLAAHPQFAVESPPDALHGWVGGRPDWVNAPPELKQAIRVWPQTGPGEGHFMVRLRRAAAATGASGAARPTGRTTRREGLSATTARTWQDFAEQVLIKPFDSDAIRERQGYLYLPPDDLPDLSGVYLLRVGLQLGELRGRGVFRPAHALALTLTTGEVRRYVNFAADSPQLAAYMAGHDSDSAGGDGWLLVAVEGFGIGWGKRVGGVVKNHYPHGWRRTPSKPAAESDE